MSVHTLKPGEVIARARASPVTWGVIVARDLAKREDGVLDAWARELFAYFLLLPSPVGGEKARQMFDEYIRTGRRVTSYDADVRMIWPRHEPFPLQIAVLRLWTALSFPEMAGEFGMAVELLAEEVGEERVKDAALLLYLHYAERH